MYGNAYNIKKYIKYLDWNFIFYQDFLIIFLETRIYIKSIYQFNYTFCIHLKWEI